MRDETTVYEEAVDSSSERGGTITTIRDSPRMWRVTWRNRETGNKIRRILTRDEVEASLAENRPAEKPLWSRDEIDAVGTPKIPHN